MGGMFVASGTVFGGGGLFSLFVRVELAASCYEFAVLRPETEPFRLSQLFVCKNRALFAIGDVLAADAKMMK